MLGLQLYEFGARQKHSVHNRERIEVFRPKKVEKEQNIQENLEKLRHFPGSRLGTAAVPIGGLLTWSQLFH